MTLGDLKILVSDYTGLEKDALHIHVALILYLGAALLFRRSPRLWPAWLLVLGVELANESYDLWQQAADGDAPRWTESLKDLWNTMLWPTALLLLARYAAPAVHRPAPPEA
jgi:cell shape-determining protein MreD